MNKTEPASIDVIRLLGTAGLLVREAVPNQLPRDHDRTGNLGTEET
jgi:hypothetical protein